MLQNFAHCSLSFKRCHTVLDVTLCLHLTRLAQGHPMQFQAPRLLYLGVQLPVKTMGPSGAHSSSEGSIGANFNHFLSCRMSGG